jgi:hypothetical protein
VATNTAGTYVPTEYDPVVGTIDGRTYRRHDIAGYHSLGIDDDEAVELVHLRTLNYHKALRVLRGRTAGIARADIDTVVHLDGYDRYVELRRAGVDHDSARRDAETVHLHRFGPGEVLSDFCPVLHTGVRTVRHTCACGHQELTSEHRNYSGD